MKKRNKQTKQSIIDWVNQMMDDPMIGKDDDFVKAYEALLKAHYAAVGPYMHRRLLKVKRQNGRIETHILFTDESAPCSIYAEARLKPADEVISGSEIK